MPSRRFAEVACAAAVLFLVVAVPPAVGEPLLSEAMFPPDSLAVVILRDGNATQERWAGTALYAFLHDPETREMLAPLGRSVRRLYAAADQAAPVPLSSLDALLTGEVGLAVSTVKTEKGPEPVVQLLIRPKDVQRAREAVAGFMQGLVQVGAARQMGKTADTTIYRFTGNMSLAVTFKNGAGLLTLQEGTGVGAHAAALARRGKPGGGLAGSPDYQAARRILPGDADVWVYVGLDQWIRGNPEVAEPLKAGMMSVGMAGLKAVVAGIKIEGRGFRTRAFLELSPPEAGRRKIHVITEEDLRKVPRDVVSFSMGRVSLTELYDRIMQLIMINASPRGRTPMQEIQAFERILGLSIRDDILAIPGDRYLAFVPEPGSPAGEGTAIFLSIEDKSAAAAKLERALNAISKAIQQAIGPRGNAFVRARKIERGQFIQIYPQSILPGAIAPTVTVMENWLCVGLSARNVLRRTEHFLSHEGSILGRTDFTATLAKVPGNYTTISYTDVGRCFDNAIFIVQFLSDLGIIALKGAAQSGELPLPLDIAQIWGMDPGRYPNAKVFRKHLFGAVAVVVPKENGYLYESFSPVGPLPVPAQSIGGNVSSQMATYSILAGMLLPALARARGEARAAASMSNMMQIMRAIIVYQEPNADNLPPSLADLFPAYLDNPRVLIAPWDKRPLTIKKGFRCSYRYIGNIPFRDVGPGQFVLYERMSRNGRRAVAHFDGHVRRYREREFRRILARQYEEFKKLMQRPDFPGDKARVKAFFEDRDFVEK